MQGSYLLKDKEIIQLDKVDEDNSRIREKMEKIEKEKELPSKLF